MENDELNDKQLEYVYGGVVPEDKLPNKFKEIKREEKHDEELSEEQLGNVFGGPIPIEDLPDNTFTDKEQQIR